MNRVDNFRRSALRHYMRCVRAASNLDGPSRHEQATVMNEWKRATDRHLLAIAISGFPIPH
jgi:hypothetical protein